jgi:hypothetical protein
MVLADKTLFVAGPPELLSLTGRSIAKQDLDAVADAYDGRLGGTLCAVSTEDGSKLAELKLNSPPVFDGLIAAQGRLFVSTMDGQVRCLGEIGKAINP